MREVSRRTGELTVAAALFLVALVWLAGSWRMPRGEFSVPGPGFFPALLGSALCLSALLLAAAALKAPAARVAVGNACIWITSAALLGLALAFEPLGFLPSVALFIGLLLRLLSSHSWTACAVAAVAAAGVAYLFFAYLLGMPLPAPRWL